MKSLTVARKGINEALTLDLLISGEDIQRRIIEYSELFNEEYQGKEVVILMIMKGALCFTADLIRHLSIPFSLDYLSCSSYGLQGTTPGELTVTGLDRLDLAGKHVLF